MDANENKADFETGTKGNEKSCAKNTAPASYASDIDTIRPETNDTKTVELIEEETEWMPQVKEAAEPTDEIVGIRVGYKETKLQGQLKNEGAKWDPRKKSLGPSALQRREKNGTAETESSSAT